jgi:hypothetical protein
MEHGISTFIYVYNFEQSVLTINLLKELGWVLPIIFIVFSYIIGFASALISSFVVERYLILRKGYPSKYRIGHLDNKFFMNFDGRKRLNWLTIIVIIPVFLLDVFFSYLLKMDEFYYKKYAEDELAIAKSSITQTLKKIHPSFETHINLDSTQFNWFKYVYHYIYENDTRHSTKIQNYVALYGFSRTIAMSFLVLFWINLLGWAFVWVQYDVETLAIHAAIFSTLAYIFFISFAKFFRRYTDEVLMASFALNSNPPALLSKDN